MYPENLEGTQVIVGSLNMGYISDTARNRTHNLFRPKRAPIPTTPQWRTKTKYKNNFFYILQTMDVNEFSEMVVCFMRVTWAAAAGKLQLATTAQPGKELTTNSMDLRLSESYSGRQHSAGSTGTTLVLICCSWRMMNWWPWPLKIKFQYDAPLTLCSLLRQTTHDYLRFFILLFFISGSAMSSGSDTETSFLHAGVCVKQKLVSSKDTYIANEALELLVTCLQLRSSLLGWLISSSRLLRAIFLYRVLCSAGPAIFIDVQIVLLYVLELLYLHFTEDFYLITYGSPEGPC